MLAYYCRYDVLMCIQSIYIYNIYVCTICWYSGALLQHPERIGKKAMPTKSKYRLRDSLENIESSESSPSPLDLRRTDCAPTSSALCGVVARASKLKLKGSKRFHNGVTLKGDVF